MDESSLFEGQAGSLELVAAAPGCSLAMLDKGLHLGVWLTLPSSGLPGTQDDCRFQSISRALQVPSGSLEWDTVMTDSRVPPLP